MNADVNNGWLSYSYETKGEKYLKCNRNKIKRINLLINQKFYANAMDTCT